MATDKIHVQICIDGLDEMLNEIRQLQTYKLGEGNEKTLVGCDDVVKVFRKHLQTKVGKPEIIRCEECRHYRTCEIFGKKITLCKRREYDALSVEPDDFCSRGVRREE